MDPTKIPSKLSYLDCRGLGSTVEGSLSLRDPFRSVSVIQRRMPNQNNLHPRERKRRNSNSPESDYVKEEPGSSGPTSAFTSATTVYSDFQKLSFNSMDNVKDAPSTSQFSGSRTSTKRSKLSAPQNNSLLKYGFVQTSSVKKDENVEVEIKQEEVQENDVEIIFEGKKEKPEPFPTTSLCRQKVKKAGQRKDKDTCHSKRKLKKNECLSQEASVKDTSSDPYGLLGLDDFDDWELDSDPEVTDDASCVQPDFFSQMPEHVLEDIFALLPLTDLLLNVTFVCLRFRNIIQNPKYLLWKKRYHELKAKKNDTVVVVKELFTDLGMDKIQNVLPSLPRCLHKFRHGSHVYDQDILKWLKFHGKYSWALRFLRKNMPDSFPALCEDPEPWCVVGAIVSLSGGLPDVTKLTQLLSRSCCTLQDMVEALYRIATFLFSATTTHKALYRYHYHVFYALYLFENEWQAKVSNLQAAFCDKGQQNILKYSEGDSNIRMTHEQMRIVNHPLQENQVVKVVAFAGTGKTSTLVQFAKLRRGLKFLLVVYNKAAQVHASRVFPGNVECRTMSSLAFTEGPGHRFKHKLTTKLRPLDIKDYLRKVSIDKNRYAYLVLNTLERFMASDSPCLTLEHVLPPHANNAEEDATTANVITDEIALSALQDAEFIWSKMCNPKDRDVRIVHDMYLKLYQLQSPVWEGYSCIMIDEAQDCTPAMLDIFLSQKCAKILVGDPNQQIYSFRGAVNALDKVESTHTYYLSQSFRFGPEISYVAHCVLAVLKNETHKTLVGGKQKSDIMGRFEGQLAIISRGNSTLFNEAVRILCHGQCRPHEPKSSEVHPYFVGGVSSYNLNQLVDIYNLRTNKEVKDRFISRFQSFQHLQMYAKNAQDQELHSKVGLVIRHMQNIVTYVQTITEKCEREDPKLANVVFTTAHKSKGLEFDTVCLTDDFSLGIGKLPVPYVIMKLLKNPEIEPNVELAAEYNILYVALTRAKKCLIMSENLRIVLQAAQENFEVPVLLESTQETCSNCKSFFPESSTKPFVLCRRALTLGNGPGHVSGLLCKDCAGPKDQQDSITGFSLQDKSRHSLVKILDSQPAEVNNFPFDGMNLYVELVEYNLII